MTEAEWLEKTDPGDLLQHLDDKISARKYRLFMCACCREIWQLLKIAECCRQSVEIAERHVDGLASDEERIQAGRTAWSYFVASRVQGNGNAYASAASCCDRPGEKSPLVRHALQVYWNLRPNGSPIDTPLDEKFFCAVIRDLVGNPFRPVEVDPSWAKWNDGLVGNLARVIYEERRFEDLPILGDALEDAGCTHADLLAHCRHGVRHYRGCWVVDALLAKG
jgi:hypothetical protein